MSLPLPAKPFFMIRHGQTDANAAKIISGGTEATLTDEGRAQAAAISEHLPGLAPGPTHIIHSGRTRTIGTAELLNAHARLPIAEDKGLDEHNFGDWIGWPTHPYVDRAQSGERPPNGESIDDLAQRLAGTLHRILTAATGTPLLVAHGGLFRAFSHLYDREKWHSANCVLHSFTPAANDAFPWRITKYMLENGRLQPIEVEL